MDSSNTEVIQLPKELFGDKEIPAQLEIESLLLVNGEEFFVNNVEKPYAGFQSLTIFNNGSGSPLGTFVAGIRHNKTIALIPIDKVLYFSLKQKEIVK